MSKKKKRRLFHSSLVDLDLAGWWICDGATPNVKFYPDGEFGRKS